MMTTSYWAMLVVLYGNGEAFAPPPVAFDSAERT